MGATPRSEPVPPGPAAAGERPAPGTGRPLASVCIPAYNQEATIAQAVQSALGQTYAPLEVVVVDDCSRDRTWDVLSGLADDRLRCFRNPANLGLAGNWNRALGLAGGRYVKLLCGDDVLYPDCLAKQVAALERHPDAAMAGCARDILSSAGRRICRRGMRRDAVMEGGDALRASIRRGGNLIGEPGAVLLRREVLDRVGGFRDHLPYMIDLDMWARVLQHGRLAAMAEPLCAFRLNPGALSCALGGRQGEEYAAFVRQLARDRVAGIGAADVAWGLFMGRVSMVLRRILYLFFAR